MPSSDMDVERPKSREETILNTNTDDFIIGDRVWVNGTKPGYIQYLGETQFAPGDWAGVVLDDHSGKNDGSVAGVRYFQCEPKRGVFARLHKLTRYPLVHATTSPSKLSDCLTTPPPIQRCLTPTRTPSPGARNIREGDRVQVVNSSGPTKTGILRYLGQTDFAAGEWAGIELDEPIGKNDGTVAGKRYFRCAPNYGLFSPAHKVSRVTGSLDRHRKNHTVEVEKENVTKNTPSKVGKDEYRKYAEESEKRMQRLRQLLEAAETERKDLASKLEQERKRVEELEFQIEEECIGKDELESEREKERRRIEELERRLEQEIRKNEMMSGGATPDSILKEETKRMNEEMEKLKDKLRDAELKIKELTVKQVPTLSSYTKSDELTRKEEALLQAQLTLENKKREVQNLLDRISELEKDLENSKARQSRQLDSIDELNMKLQKSELRNQRLEEELQTVKDKVEEMERRLKTSSERIIQLEKENKRLEEQMVNPESTPKEQTLLTRIQDKEREISDWRKEAESALSEADRLRKEKDKMKKELEEKIQKISEEHQEEWRKEKKKNTESADASALKIRELERTLAMVRADLQSARSEADARLSRQEARLQEAELKAENLERLREQVNRLQSEKELLRSEKDEIKKRLQTSEDSRTKWESEANRATEEVNLLKSQVQHLRNEFTTHREDLVKKLAETEVDAQMVQELHMQIEEQRRVVEIMQEKLKWTEGEREHLQNVLSSRQQDQVQVENSLRQEMDTLKRRLNESEAERQSLQRSLEATKLLIEEKSASQSHQQRQLKERSDREREHLERKIAELQAELRNLRNGRSDQGEEFEKLKIEKDTLEHQVHFLNSVIVDMQHKNDDLRSRLDILETEVIFDGHLHLGLSHSRSTSRLFCDICDLFDLHDTDDCPKQLSVRRTLSYSSQESEF